MNETATAPRQWSADVRRQAGEFYYLHGITDLDELSDMTGVPEGTLRRMAHAEKHRRMKKLLDKNPRQDITSPLPICYKTENRSLLNPLSVVGASNRPRTAFALVADRPSAGFLFSNEVPRMFIVVKPTPSLPVETLALNRQIFNRPTPWKVFVEICVHLPFNGRYSPYRCVILPDDVARQMLAYEFWREGETVCYRAKAGRAAAVCQTALLPFLNRLFLIGCFSSACSNRSSPSAQITAPGTGGGIPERSTAKNSCNCCVNRGTIGNR